MFGCYAFVTLVFIIYSTFITNGINILKKALSHNNITYSTISGAESNDQKENAKNKYNEGNVQVLLISKAGTNGVDTVATESIFIFEGSQWNECLDAQVCPPSWVSFGLEPASDGSRRSHLSSAATLSRLGSGSTTTPSTSTVTSGTVGRPHQRPARCHPPRAGPEGACVPARAGGYPPAWGARSPASGGSRLFTGTWPGGSAEASLGGRAAWAAASAVRAGARCALLAGGVFCA